MFKGGWNLVVDFFSRAEKKDKLFLSVLQSNYYREIFAICKLASGIIITIMN